MLAQVSLSDNPCCQFINEVPQWFFLLVHVAIFVVAAVLAVRAFGVDARTIGWGFSLFALAEISYLTYHLNITLFLLAHTLSEVFVLIGILLVGAGVLRREAAR